MEPMHARPPRQVRERSVPDPPRRWVPGAVCRPRGAVLRRHPDHHMNAPNDESRSSISRMTLAEWLALAIVVAGAALLRLLYLDQPMRNDEAYSYLNFVLP